MLDFRLLRHFCAIVEEGRIKRAAQRLNITQPTLSLSLKELEEKTGFQLINRANGKWQVTDQGQLVYEEAQKILSLLENLNEKIRNPQMTKKQLSGEVRVGCSGFCISYVKELLPILMQKAPGIKLRLFVADNVRIENRIQEKLLDFALIQLPVAFNNCKVVTLPAQRFVACWSPLLPAPPERPAGLGEIAAHPLVVGRRWANTGAIRPFMGAIQKLGLKPHIVLDTPFAAVIPDFLRSVPAIGIIPHNECSQSGLQIREIADIRLEFTSAVIWHNEMELSAQARKTLQCFFGIHYPERDFSGMDYDK